MVCCEHTTMPQVCPERCVCDIDYSGSSLDIKARAHSDRQGAQCTSCDKASLMPCTPMPNSGPGQM